MAMKKELEPLYWEIDKAVIENYQSGQTFTQIDLIKYVPKPFGSYGDVTYALKRLLNLNKIRLIDSVKLGLKKKNTYIVLSKDQHRLDKVFSNKILNYVRNKENNMQYASVHQSDILDYIECLPDDQEFTSRSVTTYLDLLTGTRHHISNVSAQLCNLRDEGMIYQVTERLNDTGQYVNVYTRVPNRSGLHIFEDTFASKLAGIVPNRTLADYSDEELLAEVRRRLS